MFEYHSKFRKDVLIFLVKNLFFKSLFTETTKKTHYAIEIAINTHQLLEKILVSDY